MIRKGQSAADSLVSSEIQANAMRPAAASRKRNAIPRKDLTGRLGDAAEEDIVRSSLLCACREVFGQTSLDLGLKRDEECGLECMFQGSSVA